MYVNRQQAVGRRLGKGKDVPVMVAHRTQEADPKRKILSKYIWTIAGAVSLPFL
jgi:hypothetical protein